MEQLRERSNSMRDRSRSGVTPQLANDSKHCRHLQRETGRCGIYHVRPFTCDFELIRTLQSEER
jgi:Fe-S-cluster containining protein